MPFEAERQRTSSAKANPLIKSRMQFICFLLFLEIQYLSAGCLVLFVESRQRSRVQETALAKIQLWAGIEMYFEGCILTLSWSSHRATRVSMSMIREETVGAKRRESTC
jgi:hypothetical protein